MRRIFKNIVKYYEKFFHHRITEYWHLKTVLKS